jgi:hypothetical protein
MVMIRGARNVGPAHPDIPEWISSRMAVFIPVPRRADPPGAFLGFRLRRLRGSISPNVVNSLASAIQTQEGYYPGSVAYQNHNPGNLVYVGQPGATKAAGGFASFSSYAAGRSALESQITLDATRGTDANGNPINTVTDLIGSWAPASDPRNNTLAYIASVAASTGYDPNAPLSSLGSDAVPTFTVDVYGSGIDATSSSSSASPAVDASMFAGGGGLPAGTVDLSALGLSSAVPWWWIAFGIIGAVVLSRR